MSNLRTFFLCTAASIAAAGCLPGIASAQTAANIDATNLINGFSLLGQTSAGRADLSTNLSTAISINNNSTVAQRAQALKDNTIASLVGSLSNGVAISDGLGPRLSGVFATGNSVSRNFSSTALSNNFRSIFTQIDTLTVGGDSAFSKNFFANGSSNGSPASPAVGIALPSGGAFNVYDTAYQPLAANANTVGDSRPVQVAPNQIQSFSGTDFFGDAIDSAVGILPTLKSNASFPSGHSAFGQTASMLLAIMVPERYQELVTRGSEFANSRIVLGAHYPLDVLGARIQSTYALVQILNNNPDYLSKTVPGLLGGTVTTTSDFSALLSSATSDLRSFLAAGCGTDIASCAASTSSGDRFADASQNKADYLDRMTYGLAPVGATDLAPVVPTGAEVLIASRFPYLSTSQLRDVLSSTEIASGQPLDDGSGYARLNLFAAAGGYGALDGNVAVAMDASRGGFFAADTWSNDISGSGSLTKTGTGTLTLTGNDTYSGATSVVGGKLVVNGTLVNSAVTLGSGASLGGSGTVAGLTAGAGSSVAPGNSIGTLSVAGDATLAAGSTYSVELAADGTSDKLKAGGTVAINGATLSVLPQTGTYSPRTLYSIIAGANVTGTFGTVSSSLAFLTATPRYSASEVGLVMTRNDLPFATTAVGANQTSLADAVDALGTANALNAAVTGLTSEESGVAYDQLSGEVHASLRNTLVQDAGGVRDAALSRLRTSWNAPVTTTDGAMLGGVWLQGYGTSGHRDGDDLAARMTSSSGGALVGIDGSAFADWRVGGFLGYGSSTTKLAARGSSADDDVFDVGVYAGRQFDALTLSLGASYSRHDLSTDRVVAFTGLSQTLTADYDASLVQGFADLGYRIALPGAAVEPFAQASYLHLRTDGFSETGGAAALTGSSSDMDMASTVLGIRGDARLMLGSVPLTVRASAGWRHGFGDLDTAFSAGFSGSSVGESIAGQSLVRDAAVLSAGFDADVLKNGKLSVAYTADQLASGAIDNQVTARFALRF